MTSRTPQEGGICNGGPYAGKILPGEKRRLPIYATEKTRRKSGLVGDLLGQYIWDDDHWEWEKER